MFGFSSTFGYRPMDVAFSFRGESMNRIRLLVLLAVLAVGALASCNHPSDYPTNDCSGVTGTCVRIQGGNETALLDAANSASAGTTIVLGKGTFEFLRKHLNYP